MENREFNYRNYSAEQQLGMSQAFPVLMRKVYVWMALALAITGMTAYYVATSPTILGTILSNNILFYGLIIAELALVIGLSAAINRLSLFTATLMFILYSVVNGATMSFIFLLYEMSSIATVFFITARNLRRNGCCGLYNQERPHVDGKDSVHGPHRVGYSIFGQYLP